MAKALVFSGSDCPICKRTEGYGMLDSLGEIGEHMIKTVQGAAIGAGAVIATDYIVPRILPAMSPTLRTILQGGIVVLGSYALKDRNPEIAAGIAIGGGSILVYKLLASMLKLPLQGLSAIMPEEISAVMPEEISGYGQDEYVISGLSDIGEEEIVIT